MPVDPAAGHQPSRTGDGPYICSTYPDPPGANNAWADKAGYCRTSLDLRDAEAKCGSSDPRCPATCKHKAPLGIVQAYRDTYDREGAQAASRQTLLQWMVNTGRVYD